MQVLIININRHIAGDVYAAPLRLVIFIAERSHA